LRFYLGSRGFPGLAPLSERQSGGTFRSISPTEEALNERITALALFILTPATASNI